MLKRFTAASLVFFSVLNVPCKATQEDPFPSTKNPCENASTYHNFYICEEALSAYVMLEKYVGGVCPEEISAQDLLNTVVSHNDKAYDEVRALASTEEIENLRARLQGAHKAGDPDIVCAMLCELQTRHLFASNWSGYGDPADHALRFAHRTLLIFQNDRIDKAFVQGQAEPAGRTSFAPSQESLTLSYTTLLLSIVRERL
ncbi:MAG: hypothetical protein C0514_00390 [Candidatus Puniceispirillum sp.]|nr:hypothetical protein [Candidatus Puniceispirillum sp.]